MSMSQKRLVAIMMTEIVGYSALTQKNEELARELLNEHNNLLKSVFSSFRGEVIKIIGNAFLVKFDSALLAVNCAIEIMKSSLK